MFRRPQQTASLRLRTLQVSGYIGKTYEESEPLHRIVVAVTEAANEALVGGRRLWVTGGAGGPGCLVFHG